MSWKREVRERVLGREPSLEKCAEDRARLLAHVLALETVLREVDQDWVTAAAEDLIARAHRRNRARKAGRKPRRGGNMLERILRGLEEIRGEGK